MRASVGCMVDDATLHQLSLSRDEYHLLLDRLPSPPKDFDLPLLRALRRKQSGYRK